MQLGGDVLTAYLRDYGSAESVTPIKLARGTAYGDYALIMCLTMAGLKTIPHTIKYNNETMMVVVGEENCCVGRVNSSGIFLPSKSHNDYYNNVYCINKQSNRKNHNSSPKTSEIETGDHQNKEEGLTYLTHEGKN